MTMMICPKAKECAKYNAYPKCYHGTPHEFEKSLCDFECGRCHVCCISYVPDKWIDVTLHDFSEGVALRESKRWRESKLWRRP